MQIVRRRLYWAIIAISLAASPVARAGAAVPKSDATVEPARYTQLCAAIVDADRAALKSVLASDFTSTDTSGKIENRAAFVADVASPGPLVLKSCAYALRSHGVARDFERDRATWTIKGTYTSNGSTQSTTGIADTEAVWVKRDARWQLRSQRILTLKQWLAGIAQPTEIFVKPLTPKANAAVVAGLREYAHPLLSAYPGGGESDLAPMLRAAGSSRVVAMGEGTHGTSEFFALKDRVFRYLVEHGGVTVFAQETNWSDGASIERYLQTGEGNLRDLLYATFAVWDNQETLELLQWMRAYNVAHPHALHFFGIDMQAPETAAGAVVAFYQRYDPSHAASVAQAEACVSAPFLTMMETLKSKAGGPKCVASTRLVFAMLANDARLQAAAGREVYLEAYHAADVAHEAAGMWSQGNFLQQATERDRAMAHNVEWMLAALYPGARVFLWAHNGHVGAGLMPWTSMGTHLRAALRSNYFAIGQTFDHGGMSVVHGAPANVPPAQGNASEVIFRQAAISPFFLDFASVPRNTPLGQWLAQPHGVRTIGAVRNSANVPNDEPAVPLASAFDGITFIDNAHAAHSFATPVSRSIAFPAGASGWLASVPWTLRAYVGEEVSGGASVLPGGKSALYLAAQPAESRLYTRLEARLDAAAYRGKAVHLRGMLATSGVTAGSSMTVAVYAKERLRPLTFQNAPRHALRGTNAWTPVDVAVTVPQNAQTIDVDFTLIGSGTAWLSEFSLEDGAVGAK